MKIRVGSSQRTRTTDPGSWLVDPVDDEDVEEIRVLRLLVLQTSDNVRSKENGRILTLIRSLLLSIITSYFTLAWQYFNVITD